jgi:hypothetical protein
MGLIAGAKVGGPGVGTVLHLMALLLELGGVIVDGHVDGLRGLRLRLSMDTLVVPRRKLAAAVAVHLHRQFHFGIQIALVPVIALSRDDQLHPRTRIRPASRAISVRNAPLLRGMQRSDRHVKLTFSSYRIFLDNYANCY